jgi:hypothetical protein
MVRPPVVVREVPRWTPVFASRGLEMLENVRMFPWEDYWVFWAFSFVHWEAVLVNEPDVDMVLLED